MRENKENIKHFGKALFELRMRKGVNQKVVGDALGISANYVGELERGKKGNPSDEIVRNLADFYEVDEAPLFQLLNRVPPSIREELDRNPDLAILIEEISKNELFTDEMRSKLYRQIKRYYLELVEDGI